MGLSRAHTPRELSNFQLHVTKQEFTEWDLLTIHKV